MQVVIMAGGAGTRFWPLSRRHRPKQMLSLFGDRPMVAETVARFDGLVAPEDIWIVTSEQLVDAVAEALPQVPRDNLLAEPMGRNTAPCIGMAAVAIRDRLGRADEVMAVFPADHFIRDDARFRDTVARAADVAGDGAIVTLGIEPTHPETGYGYIQRGEVADDGSAEATRFVEKPDRDTAMRYLRDGHYLWNAGIFVARVDALLAEFERQLPELNALLEPVAKALIDHDEGALAEAYAKMTPVSVDYGIMEGAERVRVVPAHFGWSDVGHWDALPEVAPTDEQGNVAIGDVVAIDTRDSVLVGHDRRVLAVVGLDRIVVVDSEDALLVAPRDRVQEVRAIVESLKGRDGDLT